MIYQKHTICTLFQPLKNPKLSNYCLNNSNIISMYTFFIVLIAIVAVLIIGTVLLQSGKGDGLSGMAASGATTQLLGTRQAPDVLEKITWGLAGVFVVLCLATTFFTPGQDVVNVIKAPAGVVAPKPAAPATTPAPTGTATPAPAATPAPTGTATPAPAANQPAPELKFGGKSVPITGKPATPAPAPASQPTAPKN
jgi:preprotein translocase subunit SecG